MFTQLKHYNRLLFYSGLCSLLMAVVCAVILCFDNRQVLGINLWIKPIKFLLSIVLFNWSMAWYLHYLQRPVAVRKYSVMVVVVFAFEMVVIIGQAARGQLSHFNISTPLSGALFSMMGVAIVILTLWTLYMALLFFKTPHPQGLTTGFWWGIRLGLLVFVVFALQGGLMASRLSHTVGAPDGGSGLPFFNWSTRYGDLRVAHFIGMHALQVLPLLGWWLFKKRTQIIMVGLLYSMLATWALWRAWQGYALLW